MDKEALKKDIEAVVANIWSEKEEVEVRKRTEEALQKSADTITELTASLEGKETEFAELEEKNTASEAEIQKLKTELEAAQKKLDESKETLTASEKTIEDLKKDIEDMRKDKAADLRMAEFEELKISHSDKDVQRAKIRDLSEDDFVAYRDELSNLRKAVESELAKTKKTDEELAEEKAKKEQEELLAAKKKEEELANKGKGDETKIGPGHMALAALNLETKVTDEMSEQYQELGKALAASWAGKKE
ncbi:MAG: hypothetical protein U9Q97_05750 [Acidobacteriota bacterium]|nr:hypothetical protein [Acidobacteriota bacterium]